MLIGTDTELFLKNADGTYRSAHGAVPGSKKSPYPVKKGMVQVDGMALEFGVDPAHDFKTFQVNVNTVLQRLQDLIPDGTEMSLVPQVHFDEAHMAEQPDEAILLGCDPDYDPYTMDENPAPEPHPTMRTAGGHIHIGFANPPVDAKSPVHFAHCAAVAKQLDYHLGLLGVVHDREGAERKQMYGKPGAFRPKPYGIEYRVLSNFWLLDGKMMGKVFGSAQRAMTNMDQNRFWPDFFKEDTGDHHSWDAQKILLEDDYGSARHCLLEMGEGYEA